MQSLNQIRQVFLELENTNTQTNKHLIYPNGQDFAKAHTITNDNLNWFLLSKQIVFL